MNIVLISTTEDAASANIREQIIHHWQMQQQPEPLEPLNSLFGNIIFKATINNNSVGLFQITTPLITAENIDDAIKKEVHAAHFKKTDLIIFLSKHVSKEQTPALTVHSIGNWGRADFGGKEHRLCPTSGIFIRKFYLNLLAHATKYCQIPVTLEATHHGPYVETPAVFIEIGSTPAQWNEPRYGKIMAGALYDTIGALDSLQNFSEEMPEIPTAIGLGGPHYCNTFNKLLQRMPIAFGYICPKHNLENFDDDLLSQALGKCAEKVDFTVLDWKGLGQHKEKIIALLQKNNISYKRSDQILNGYDK